MIIVTLTFDDRDATVARMLVDEIERVHAHAPLQHDMLAAFKAAPDPDAWNDEHLDEYRETLGAVRGGERLAGLWACRATDVTLQVVPRAVAS